jgi:hypothetical protein
MSQLYTWVRVCVLKDNSIQFIYGAPTDNKDSEPSETVVNELYNTRYGSLINAGTTDILRIPEIPLDAFEIHRFCVYGTQGVVAETYTDYRSNYSNIQGLALTWTTNNTGETVFSITAGSFTAPNLTRGRISIGSEGEKFYKRKDAFTEVVELQVSKGRYKVTVQRNNANFSNEDLQSNGDPVPQPAEGNSPQQAEFKRYNKGYLFSITGYNTTVNPISPPPLCTIAKTALSITSNKNLNGTLEGVNGLVTSICRDYNPSTQSWNLLAPTNNPASLFLHILTHPANAYRVQPGVGEQESDYINFTVLTEWWTFCSEQGFVYNNVITDSYLVYF